MSDGFLVHVNQCFYYVLKEAHCLSDSQSARLVQVLEKSATVHVLHHQIHILRVFKAAVELDDIRVF